MLDLICIVYFIDVIVLLILYFICAALSKLYCMLCWFIRILTSCNAPSNLHCTFHWRGCCWCMRAMILALISLILIKHFHWCYCSYYIVYCNLFVLPSLVLLMYADNDFCISFSNLYISLTLSLLMLTLSLLMVANNDFCTIFSNLYISLTLSLFANSDFCTTFSNLY
jgi:hypothetical protein